MPVGANADDADADNEKVAWKEGIRFIFIDDGTPNISLHHTASHSLSSPSASISSNILTAACIVSIFFTELIMRPSPSHGHTLLRIEAEGGGEWRGLKVGDIVVPVPSFHHKKAWCF